MKLHGMRLQAFVPALSLLIFLITYQATAFILVAPAGTILLADYNTLGLRPKELHRPNLNLMEDEASSEDATLQQQRQQEERQDDNALDAQNRSSEVEERMQVHKRRPKVEDFHKVIFGCNGFDNISRCLHGGLGPILQTMKDGRICTCLCLKTWGGPECDTYIG